MCVDVPSVPKSKGGAPRGCLANLFAGTVVCLLPLLVAASVTSGQDQGGQVQAYLEGDVV